MIVNLRESLNTRDRKSVNGNSKYYDLVNLYESCNLSADNKKTLAKMINNNASDKAMYNFLYECYEGKEDIKEDTVKKDGKWVNKGKEGTHGEFKTKKAADAQRKAMFAKSIFSIHGNVFRKNGIDTDEVVVARNLSWQEAKDKLDRMQYNSNAIDMYADVWIYNDTLDREEEHWDTKGYFKDEENNYYESCSKDFEEAVKSKKSFSVKDKLKKLIPDLDI